MTDKEARKQNVGGEVSGIYLVRKEERFIVTYRKICRLQCRQALSVTIGANNEVTVKGPKGDTQTDHSPKILF